MAAADKKLSQLAEKVSEFAGTDLVYMVASSTPYRVQVKNFLSGLRLELPQTSRAGLSLIAAVTANATSATLAAADFTLQANSSIGVTVQDRIGLRATNEILNATSNVTGQMWGAHIKLDPGASNFAAANTFGVVIDHTISNTSWTRAVAPRAYIGIKEQAGTNGLTTSLLMDIGAQGNVVSSNLSTGNASVVMSKANTTTATHKLKISVNGTEYWLMATDAF